MQITILLKVCLEGQPARVQLELDFDPGRPPPPCSNPNSPAFSDPGDPAEYEVQSGLLFPLRGRVRNLTPPELQDIETRYDNEIFEKACQALEDF